MTDYKVADIGLAEFGRREIALAEGEMPALMALRRKYRDEQPLAGARIVGCIHMTIQTAVLIETLVALGAEVRWSSCNIFSTQDHAAAAMAAAGIPVFAWKGETEEEYEWCIEQTILEDGAPWNANLLLDDGGDLTLMIHEKYREDLLDDIRGISGGDDDRRAPPLRDAVQQGTQACFVRHTMDVNNSVTKSKFDNLYGCRESLTGRRDQARGGHAWLRVRPAWLVIGFGDVGKGSSHRLLKGMGMHRVCDRRD